MRALIVSTPRSGNTWFRRLLSGALDLPAYAVHRPWDLNWDALPEECIVQMHWRVRPEVLEICRDFDFRPILIVRHPLDVLISILHFCSFEPATQCWLNGEGGGERSIRGKDPTDPAFTEYATSPRAAALLSPSVEWIQLGVPHLRFEDLVSRTEEMLEGFLARLEARPARLLPEVIDENTLEKSRNGMLNRHCWLGRPGLWPQLIPAEAARRIHETHAGVFQSLGYGIDCAYDRTAEEIRDLWRAIA